MHQQAQHNFFNGNGSDNDANYISFEHQERLNKLKKSPQTKENKKKDTTIIEVLTGSFIAVVALSNFLTLWFWGRSLYFDLYFETNVLYLFPVIFNIFLLLFAIVQFFSKRSWSSYITIGLFAGYLPSAIVNIVGFSVYSEGIAQILILTVVQMVYFIGALYCISSSVKRIKILTKFSKKITFFAVGVFGPAVFFVEGFAAISAFILNILE